MLPIIFTRRYLLERMAEKRSNPGRSMIYSAEDNLYAVRRVDTAAVPVDRSTMVFECDLHHGVRSQKVFLGLMETDAVGIAARSPGIGVSVDLMTGLITDVVNNQGVLGYLENPPCESDGPVHVKLEVELIGRVVLPTITIGEEIILHPALYLDAQEGLSALVGTSMHPFGDARFENTVLHRQAPAGRAVLSAE